MPKTAGLKFRVALASPEKVNETTHRLAIKMATEEKATSWRLMFQLPDIGVVQWTEHLSKAAKERLEEMQPRARPRVKPNASVDHCGHELHGSRGRRFHGSSSKAKDPRAETTTTQQAARRKEMALLQAV